MWTHTVLEIYPCIDTTTEGGLMTYLHPWPFEGEPADWIEDGLVGYTQGRLEDVVILTPLWKLLWWKLRGWLQQ